LKSDTKGKKPGWIFYEDQIANIKNLKKIIKYL